jgi:four helix bundle protein
MQDCKKLAVWSKAHLLVKDIYSLTIAFPKEELYGLVSQIRRASVSIPTNIAEGSGKASKPDFGRYLQIAFGSANEVEYLLFLAFELKYISQDNFEPLSSRLEEIKKMLAGLLKSLNRPQ